MPYTRTLLRIALAGLAGLGPPAAWGDLQFGDLPPLTLSADAAVGVEYDSNVSVEEVERSSDESDYAFTLELGGEAEQQINPNLEVGVNYDYSQSNYRNFSDVDRQTHIFGSNLAWDLGDLNLDFSGFYIHARLDGEPFLDLRRVSPSLSGFVARRWYLRGAYVYQDKSLENSPSRDAIAHSGEIDLYFFARGLRRYVNLGYRFKDEDARTAWLDYQSHGLKLRYIHRLELFSRLAKLELSWRFEDRDYSTDTPTIGERRKDRRNRGRIDLEYPLGKNSAAQFYYGYGDYDSNLERVDYIQDIAGARLVHRW
jgi:hypothetical protein